MGSIRYCEIEKVATAPPFEKKSNTKQSSYANAIQKKMPLKNVISVLW